VKLYDSMTDREMREQLIFVYSQRREDAALDKLFQIGRTIPTVSSARKRSSDRPVAGSPRGLNTSNN